MTKKDILNITKNLTVLYVEDDKNMRMTSIELFQNFFNKTLVACDGLDALRIYNINKIDVIITDISMPHMDGIEFIKKIRQHNLTIPIIVYSALNNPTSVSACITLNVDAYLLKPMIAKNFIEALEKVTLKIMNTSGKSTLDIISKIEEKFNIDRLTGLQSHNLLMDKIENLNTSDTPVVLLINIDKFHIYNELYGFEIGDLLLQNFAKILKYFAEKNSYDLFRMSGDEFVLLKITKIINLDLYMQDIEALIAYINANPITLTNIKEPIHLSITLGISFDKNSSYTKANIGLLEARKQGRPFLIYNTEEKREEGIKKALQEKRVHTYYQPVVDKNSNTLKYESLICIEKIQSDGTKKIISPTDFLDFSQISQQYVHLKKIMINESFQAMLELNIHISINLTFQDIENKEINKLLRENIKKHHLESKTNFDISSQVIFELLEYPSHKDYDLFVSFINEFKSLGVVITINNFGLGFSDMLKVMKLAPHYAKIDANLIKNIDNDAHAYSLVKAIVECTQELGIKTIAENVSSKEIFERAVELGVNEFQGFLFGEPLARIEAQ